MSESKNQYQKTNSGNVVQEEVKVAKSINADYKEKFGFSDDIQNTEDIGKGISKEQVIKISKLKNEPKWMLERRLLAYDHFKNSPSPTWGAKIDDIDYENIHYYVRATDKKGRSWNEVPEKIKQTFEKLGIPQAERKFLAGVASQYESEVIYHKLKKKWEDMGVIFEDTDTALKKYPEIFKKHFGTVIPYSDNKLAALNTAVWSGGSFIYVPKGAKIKMPLQAYFRINAQNMGQFERTLIIADEGAEVHYIEGCLPIGEMISTGDSWVRIETIKPGDFVIGENGYLSRVSKIMVRKYKGLMYTIKPLSAMNAFSLTPEHPVLSIKRESVLKKRKPRNNWLPEVNSKLLREMTPEYRPVKDLSKGDFLIFPKIKDKLINPETKLSNELIEFLGFYTAEGSVTFHKTLKQYIVSLTFSENEQEIVNRVKDLIHKIIGKKANQFNDAKKHAIVVSVYSKELHDICLEQCGKYAYEKKLSSDLMNLPSEKQKIFFEAYFKGDGNLSVKKYNSHLFRASTASYSLAIQLQEILARLNIFASIRLRKGGEDKILNRKIQRKDQYIISYTLPKGWSEVRETKDYFIVPIKEITTKEYADLVFNLEVEGVDSYLVKGFTVHNCTAPTYTTDSLHSAVVEIICKPGSKVRYTTIQNWSENVYNLVTKRAYAFKDATMEWVDCNLGSKVTMKYPAIYLMGEHAHGEVLSIALAGKGQHQDAGAKIIHRAKNTSSVITSKSICKDGGRTSYRGLLKIHKGAKNSKAKIMCDALILDDISQTDTYPTNQIDEKQVMLEHEASVSKVSEEQMFYLMSRGIDEATAAALIVSGFIEPVLKELPMEYAAELNALIQMSMEGSVG